jgi:hypothetical protein
MSLIDGEPEQAARFAGWDVVFGLPVMLNEKALVQVRHLNVISGPRTHLTVSDPSAGGG